MYTLQIVETALNATQFLLWSVCRDVAAHDANGDRAGGSKSGKEDWSGTFEWDKRAADIRLNLFGIKSYRQNQHEVHFFIFGSQIVLVLSGLLK